MAALYAGLATAAWVAYEISNDFTPRVSTETGLSTLRAIDRSIQDEMTRVVKAPLGDVLQISNPSPVTWELVTGIRERALDVTKFRQLFLSQEQAFIWTSILDDIGDLHARGIRLEGSDPDAIAHVVSQYADALGELVARQTSSAEVAKQADATLQRGQSRHIHDDIRMLRMLLAAFGNRQVMFESNREQGFDDILALQRESWRLYELHQRMVRAHSEKKRMLAAARVLIGR